MVNMKNMLEDEMETVDIYALLDELQEEIDLAKNCMFSKNKSVEPEVLNEIIQDIRAALDDTLEYSRQIEAEKDRILTEAQTEADGIIKRAQADAQAMVAESAMVKSAQEQAQKIVDKAKQKAAEVKKIAVEYADDIFADLDEYYKESMNLLKENRIRLGGKSAE